MDQHGRNQWRRWANMINGMSSNRERGWDQYEHAHHLRIKLRHLPHARRTHQHLCGGILRDAAWRAAASRRLRLSARNLGSLAARHMARISSHIK